MVTGRFCSRAPGAVLCLIAFALLAQGKLAADMLVATDYPNINAAFEDLREKGGTLYLPKGYYVTKETLNLAGLGYGQTIRIVGDGLGSVIVGETNGKPIIDMTATGMVSMSHIRINSRNANVGILHGRSGGGSAGCCHFEYVRMDGEYSLACVYNVGSEVNRHFNCYFSNHAKGGHGYIFTGKNYWNVESPYQKMDYSACNTDLSFYGCFWGVYGGAGSEVNLYLLGPVTADVCVFGGDMSNKSGGRAAVLLDGRGSYVLSVRIQGVRFETQGAKHCVEATHGHTFEGVQIRENFMLSQEETILGHRGVFTNWTVKDNMLESWKTADWGRQTGRAAVRFSNLKNSYIEATSGRLDRSNPQDTKADSAATEAELAQHKDQRRFARTSIVVDNSCMGNHFIVRRSEDVRLPANTQGTRVTVLNDGGYRREYYHGAGVGTPVLLNLVPCDSQAIASPKRGDVVMDSGKNTPDGRPTLAVFDGQRWRYLRAFESGD